MADVPELRISDGDRQRTIDQLTAAYGEGRLDLDEFEDRVSQAQAAKIQADLTPLTRDLPAVLPGGEASVLPSRPQEEPWSSWFRKELGFFVIPPIVCTGIWALTDFGGYYWPMWVWLGCLTVIAIGIVEGRDSD